MYWEQIKSHKMSIIQILKMTIKLFRDNLKAILISSLIIFIPINIAISLIPIKEISEELISVYNQIVSSKGTAVDTTGIMILANETLVNYTKWNLIAMCITQLFGSIAVMTTALITYQFIDGNKLDYKSSLEGAFAKWFKAAITLILASFIMMGLSIFMVIPALIFAVYANFIVYVVILKNQSGMRAISYSFRLVRTRFFRTLGIIILIYILQYTSNYIIVSLFYYISSNTIITFIVNCLSTIVGSFFWVFQTIWFLNYDFTTYNNNIN